MYGPEPPPQTPAPSPVSAAEFRVKAAFMKTWKPGQTPSNRDRLELYAWHKQAVTGDAPLTTSPNTAQDAASRAKWNAWRSKRGMDQAQSMARYVAEANRQLLVYGTTESLSTASSSSFNNNKQHPYNNDTTVTPSLTPTTPAHHVSSSSGNGAGGSGDELLTPRGLAAVPLLCAATAETRVAYLARLSQTLPDHGWWARQEALCGMPGSFAALPESVVLFVACRCRIDPQNHFVGLQTNGIDTGIHLGGRTNGLDPDRIGLDRRSSSHDHSSGGPLVFATGSFGRSLPMDLSEFQSNSFAGMYRVPSWIWPHLVVLAMRPPMDGRRSRLDGPLFRMVLCPH
eukprot:scaffold43944_cov59-Attheya_sp.AAC.11